MTNKEKIEALKRQLILHPSYLTIIEELGKDLDVLEILKKQIKITEDREDTGFGNYTMTYYLNITSHGLDFAQFNKIREWLNNDNI